MGKTRNPYIFYEAENTAVKRLSKKYGKSEAEIVRIAVRVLDDYDKAQFVIPQLKKKK